MTGDIKLNVGSDLIRSLGCNDLTTGKSLHFCWNQIQICYRIPYQIPTYQNLCRKKTDVDFVILINQLPTCDFRQDVISCSQLIDVAFRSIKNVMSKVNKLYAVNKAYADRIKYKTVTRNILNTVMTDHMLFTFPAAKTFASGKIKICETWVERLAD